MPIPVCFQTVRFRKKPTLTSFVRTDPLWSLFPMRAAIAVSEVPRETQFQLTHRGPPEIAVHSPCVDMGWTVKLGYRNEQPGLCSPANGVAEQLRDTARGAPKFAERILIGLRWSLPGASRAQRDLLLRQQT